MITVTFVSTALAIIASMLIRFASMGMIITTTIFAFQAKVRRGRERKPRHAVLRDSAPLGVVADPKEGIRQAYWIEDRRSCRFFPVFRYQDRLWWPLEMQERHVMAEEALGGTINLFGDDLLEDDVRSVDEEVIAWWDSSDHKITVRGMQAKCADLMVLDGGLYAAGGVPLVAYVSRKFRVISTGGDRSGRPLITGLAIQPGRHGLFETDFAITAGKIWMAHEAAFEEAYRRSRLRERGKPVVDQIEPSTVDFFQVRLDAAFRLIDRIGDRKPSGFPRSLHSVRTLDRTGQPPRSAPHQGDSLVSFRIRTRLVR
jgi:hypothetical protein